MLRAPRRSVQTTALLNAMAARPGSWQYGYDLSRRTGLKSGTLYPLLIRLSDRGLLEARWQPPEHPGLPARHAYRLTPGGRAFAKQIAGPIRRTLPRRKLAGAEI